MPEIPSTKARPAVESIVKITSVRNGLTLLLLLLLCLRLISRRQLGRLPRQRRCTVVREFLLREVTERKTKAQ